jgi:predicted RNA binding protein YcfA (HicA-like mRNA interferase family)
MKLSPVSWDDFVRRLKELGFEGPFSGGKHPKMRKGNVVMIIPNKHEGDIGAGFLSRLLKQAGISRNEWNKNQSGMSIIATVMLMMILALFAAIGVSLVTTGSNVAVQEERGLEAFYIADGGLQYTIKANNFPNFDIASTNLGNGSFTVTVPTLTSNAAVGDTTLSVSSTDGFIPNPGDSPNYWIMLCGITGTPRLDLTASNTCEKISCTTISATPAQFTVCTRGRDSSSAVAHPGNATPSSASVVLMYSWKTANPSSTLIATRALARNHKCTTPATTICVASTTDFADAGFIRINDGTPDNIEDVFYSGKGNDTTACGGTCTACLGTSGCTRRAYDGNKKGTISHAINTIVYQSEITALPTSTGVISGLVLTGSIQRVVQGTVRPLY